MAKSQKREIAVNGDFTETLKGWMLWDWEHNIPITGSEDGEFVIYFDPEIAEEHRARTVTICIHNEDGSEEDENVYKL